MLSNETNSNLNSAETKQDDLDLNKMMQDPSNAELIDNPQAQQNKLPGLLKRSIKDFSTWPTGKQALAVGAACGLISAILPLVAVGLGLAISAIPGAIVGLTVFFAVKAVQSGYKGLKWSAEKTVEGAKHLGGKIKDGYEYSADSLKRGASFVSERAADKLHKAAGKEDYLDKIKRFTLEEIKKSDEIRNNLKEIFTDKDRSVKSILSGISSKIDSKIKEKTELEQIDHTSERLLDQGKFINKLSEERLHSLLTQRSLPKDTYLIDSIFSEHYGKIKEVIREYKIDQSVKRNNAKDAEERKISKSFSFSSLERNNSEQSNSLPKSSSTDSLSSTYSTTRSKAELLNPNEHKEVNATSLLRNKLSSSLEGKKAPEEARKGTNVEDHVLSESDGISTASQSSLSEDVSNDPTVKQNLDALSSRPLTSSDSVSSLASNSGHSSAISTSSGIDDSIASKSNSFSYHGDSDSGFNSPSSSTPQRHSPSQETRFGLGVTEELTEKLAERRAIVDQPNVESVQQKAEPSKG